jgi:sortase (surface protein transpeptidase)
VTGFALSGSWPAPAPPAITLGGSASFPASGFPASGFPASGFPASGPAAGPRRTVGCTSARAVSAGTPARPLSFSAPVQVAIPSICVRASVIPLGENPDGTVQVPPLSMPRLTSWFDAGPAPGQPGPAALYGHVATAASGPAVFYRLGDLVPGDTVDITRADHRVAVFVVYRVAEYPKSAFPTMTVYGDTPGPELRLITCGGAFDASAGSYLDNIVVYARLTAVTAP